MGGIRSYNIQLIVPPPQFHIPMLVLHHEIPLSSDITRHQLSRESTLEYREKKLHN